ncbi:MAG: hypothetical protein ACKVT1_18530 [Dehalococcoidia bacterium]
MRHKRTMISIVAGGALLLAIPVATAFGSASPPASPAPVYQAATAASDAFTYQGRLTENNAAANAQYDLQFILYDAVTGGAQVVGSTVVTKDNVQVTNGVFSVDLDFGATAFNGDARWLEIGVRTGTSTGTYTVLSPRQPITAAPYALYAKKAPIALPFTGAAEATATAAVMDVSSSSTGTGSALIARRLTTSTATPAPAILATNAGAGPAIRGESSAADGTGGEFKGSTGINIDGAIKVSGNRSAFVHTAANRCEVNALPNTGTFIDNPLTNGDSAAILIVTLNGITTSSGPAGFAVVYDTDGLTTDPKCSAGKWVIYATNGVVIPASTTFNVLVIKQ